MEIIFQILIIMGAIILHECAHGWTAFKLGDPTAKEAGRLTLNPIKHIDPFGTIIFPGILFLLRYLGNPVPVLGWAKPVPINFRRLKSPKRDMVLVAVAGPATNMMIALAASQIYQADVPLLVKALAEFTVAINVLLAVFNMIPVPPLDGSRLVAGLLPNALANRYLSLEPYGILIVMVLLGMGLLGEIIDPVMTYILQLLGVTPL